MNIQKILSIFIILQLQLVLVACGGGGGGGGSVTVVDGIDTSGTTVIADAGADQSGSTSITVALNGTGSTTTGEGPITYNWMLNSKPTSSVSTIQGSDTANPTLSLDKPGQYVVALVASDDGVNSLPDTVLITAYSPIADAGPNQMVPAGSTVALDGSGSTYAGGGTLIYNWTIQSVPNGSSATLFDSSIVNPSFIPDLEGEYIIGLIVNNGTVDSTEDTVLIQSTPPIANAGPDQLVSSGETVNLDGSGSFYGGEGSIFYNWSLISTPSGSSAVIPNNTIVTPSFVADIDGEFTINLTVGNGTVKSAVDTVVVQATTVPVADAGPDRTVSTGRVVSLDGTASSTSNTATLTYNWVLKEKPFNSAAVLSDSNSSSPVFTADLSGNYSFGLIVSNGTENSIEDTVLITAMLPLAGAGLDKFVSVMETVNLDASGSSDPELAVLAISWEIKEKPFGSIASLSSFTSVTPNFTPDIEGDYVISLTVSNDVASSLADEIIVTAMLPVASAGSDQHVSTGSTVTLHGEGSMDSGGKTLTYTWQMDSKPTNSLASLTASTTQQPTFITDLDGDYEMSLVVNNGFVDSLVDTVVIASTTAPVAVAGPDQSVSVNEVVSLDGSASSDSNSAPLIMVWSLKSIPSGSSATLSSTTSINPVFTADVAGDYIIGLVVNNGVENSLESEVMVLAELPVADAGPDYNVALGDTMILDARSSSDVNLYPLTYQWSIDNNPINSTAVLSSNVIETPSFTPDVEGSYDISLIVNNGFTDSVLDSILINSRTSVGNSSGIYSSDFEDSGSNSLWSADNGVWEIGVPTSGPNIAYVGSNVMATNLSGTHELGTNSRMVSGSIVLPDIVGDDKLVLKFWHWFELRERGCSNSTAASSSVQISENLSIGVWSEWATLSTYVNSSGGWSTASIDLSGYAGKTVKIGFYVISHVHGPYCSSVGWPTWDNLDGWYIDELIVEKVIN